jgi:hypothetical protein
VVVYSYHPSYAGSVNGGSLFRPHWALMQDPIRKIPKAKRGMAQVIRAPAWQV